MTEEPKEESKEEEKKEEPLMGDAEMKSANERLADLQKTNDMIEKETMRFEMLKAKAQIGGKTLAGQREPTPEEEAQEEASKILKNFT